MKNAAKDIRVGIDCRDLLIAKTGSKTYLSELLIAAENLGSDEASFIPLRPFLPIINLSGRVGKLLRHVQFIFWKQITLPVLAKIEKCDVLICTDYFLPSLKFGIKHVVVFHDAFFWEYPSHYNQYWLKLFNKWAVPAAERAEKILVPSKYVQKRLHHFMHVDDPKISVVYEAPKSFKTNNISKHDLIHPPTDPPYLLHVGVLSKHKNLPMLIKAFKQALNHSQKDWRLILVGGSGNSSNDDDTLQIKNTILEEGLEGKVLLTGYLNDDEVGAYYRNASGYIFPSYNEGFGLPILEAMRFNLAIAAANNTCLPEIGKDAAIYFDPYNLDDLAGSIEKIITRDKDVLEALARQSAVLYSFSWDKAALEITAICCSIS